MVLSPSHKAYNPNIYKKTCMHAKQCKRICAWYVDLRNIITEVFTTHTNNYMVDSLLIITFVLVDLAESLPRMMVSPQGQVYFVLLGEDEGGREVGREGGREGGREVVRYM